jgi:methylenetetrahydrofolate dehydrogenase (NADP+)/methenyltetrahydrofolate cyclohydrolase
MGDPTGFVPCTPAGVHELLIRSGVRIDGAHVVVLGRSRIVGRPVSLILSQKAAHANATVTVCHSRSRNLAEICRSADVLIAAIGVPGFVKANMVRDGAVVIDVGVNRLEDKTIDKGYRIVGDVDFDAVSQSASLITPVPGGVGPMTIAMLMHNTVRAARMQHGAS